MIELNRIKVTLLFTVALLSSTTVQAMREDEEGLRGTTVLLGQPSAPENVSSCQKRAFRLEIVRTLRERGIDDSDHRLAIADEIVQRHWGKKIDDNSLLLRAQVIHKYIDPLLQSHDCPKIIINTALAESHEEIEARALAINHNKAILLPVSDRPILKLWYFDVVLRALGLSSKEINARAQAIEENVAILFPKGIDTAGRLGFIARALDIDAREIHARTQAIIEQGTTLFHEGIEVNDRLTMTLRALQLSADEIKSRMQAIRKSEAILFPKGIYISGRFRFVYQVLDVDAEEIYARALAIREQEATLFHADMKANGCLEMTLRALQLPADEIKSRLQAIRENGDTLFPVGISVNDHMQLIPKVLKLRAAVIASRLQAIIDYEDVLLLRNISEKGIERLKVVESILRLNTDEIKLRLQAIREKKDILFPKGIKENNRLEIMQEALKLSAEKIRKSDLKGGGDKWVLRISSDEETQVVDLERLLATGCGLKVSSKGRSGASSVRKGNHEDHLIIAEKLPFKFNPSFQWISKQRAVPEGYQFVQDPQQKAKTKWGPLNILSKRKGCASVTGDGYVFYYQLASTEMKSLDKQSFVFEVDVKSSTPGAYIQYWGFPQHQKLMSHPHTGSGKWQTLSIEFTVDGNDKQFFLYPAIMPGVGEGSEAPIVKIKNVHLRKGQ
ncbi:MAG: hypothetical protein K2P93_08165 [Alphaproteobacteria bacterium]|nr:hypothetical protein [Alphaproteobacteria bacterium]